MAFLLDTVTLSEFRKKSKAARAVIAWQNSVGAEQAYVSVITLNEIRYGIRMVEKRDPAFSRNLETWYREILAAPFLYAILPVSIAIAEQAADYRAAHDISVHDSLIAATARLHRCTLATRNVRDFEATDLSVVNPWDYAEHISELG